MKMLAIARKNALEIIRDPLNICFGLGFPLAVLLLLSAIQANVPVPLFRIEILTPGIAVFGLSFLSLFAATSLSRDRNSALLQRLYTTPLRPADFILGYSLPLLSLALMQVAVCLVAAMILGLPFSFSLLAMLLFSVFPALFFIALGLFFGSFLTDKQAGGVCGALLANLTAWLSGAWFDLTLVGGVFEKIAHALPFYHAVQMEKILLQGDFSAALPHLLIVSVYALAAVAAAIFMFLRQMKKQ